MAKSMRSKRKKRLRAIRKDIVAPELTVLKKEAAKLAAQEAVDGNQSSKSLQPLRKKMKKKLKIAKKKNHGKRKIERKNFLLQYIL
ncbi:hypothetical protein R3W88_012443 [Solanum pinnatisectum]|uniref:Uncharacterized protein n=1 Tax=Solanum pinnatisectum TaxID=50273 RepID=A0AAV9LCQ7_9SOLN|nr:hypothetical protein R3W88_012443 [Solanum pinnatisectum]